MVPLSKHRLLLTGATGFVGSHLLEVLRASFPTSRVIPVVRRSNRNVPGAQACDLSDGQAVRRLLKRLKPDLIFHAAGRAEGTPEELMRANLLTTAHLLNALADIHSQARLVVLGSAAEHGPLTPYAWSKCCQSLLAQQRGQEGANVVIARLFNLTGPRLPARFVAGRIAQQIADAERTGRRWLKIGNLEPRRDFLDVRDAARALLVVARRGQTGRIYEICSGRSHRIRTILKFLLHQAKHPLKVRPLPPANRSKDVAVSRGNPSTLQHLGWKPRISLYQSLNDTLAYYRLNTPPTSSQKVL